MGSVVLLDHAQLSQGKKYVFKMNAKATAPFDLILWAAPGDADLGSISVGTQWNEYTVEFTPKANYENFVFAAGKLGGELDIKKIGNVDIVIGGRQAIDGDTAQVGPQVAQKLGLNQVTYAEEILKVEGGKATIRRHIDGGVETVVAPLPVVITVNGSAAPCRPCNAKLVMKYKYASCPMERKENDPRKDLYKAFIF